MSGVRILKRLKSDQEVPLKKVLFLNRLRGFLALLLTLFFVFYFMQCFAWGLIGCYGPGCHNFWCNWPFFWPLAFLTVLTLISTSYLEWWFSVRLDQQGGVTFLFDLVIHFFLIYAFFYLALFLLAVLWQGIKRSGQKAWRLKDHF